jgi:hypothetical protein
MKIRDWASWRQTHRAVEPGRLSLRGQPGTDPGTAGILPASTCGRLTLAVPPASAGRFPLLSVPPASAGGFLLLSVPPALAGGFLHLRQVSACISARDRSCQYHLHQRGRPLLSVPPPQLWIRGVPSPSTAISLTRLCVPESERARAALETTRGPRAGRPCHSSHDSRAGRPCHVHGRCG